MANAIKYAGTERPGQDGAYLHYHLSDDILIKVFDNGQGFDINSIPPPNFEELEDRGEGYSSSGPLWTP